MQGSFQMRYPALTGRFVTRDLVDDLLNDMDDGLCVAAVVMEDAWERQLVSKHYAAIWTLYALVYYT